MSRMNRLWFLPFAASISIFALAACSAAPPPAPTAAPQKAAPTAAPQQAAAPTAAPQQAAAPTAAAKPTEDTSKKVAFPEKGKTITIIVSAAAGGSADVCARLLAVPLEKVLGTAVQVVNRPGAGWQVGLTELATAKPDGYTIGYTILPTTITLYLDPERKAVFNRKSFQTLAMHVIDPGAIGVPAESKYRDLKDLMEAAKANPGKVSVGAGGILGDDHLGTLQLEQSGKTKFATVQYDGAGVALPALFGGHIEAYADNVSTWVPQRDKTRILAVFDKKESPYAPGVKTAEAQGYPAYMSSSRGLGMPAGAPKEVVDTLSSAIKKAMEDPEHQQKMKDMGLPLTYMNPSEFDAYWTEVETAVKPLMELGKQ